jgi:hypothetical protein
MVSRLMPVQVLEARWTTRSSGLRGRELHEPERGAEAAAPASSSVAAGMVVLARSARHAGLRSRTRSRRLASRRRRQVAAVVVVGEEVVQLGQQGHAGKKFACQSRAA